ncbi:FG-GAP and VCBS repeat-containing protein [Nonomuraea sp. SBT364]|uniref:FG-GAP and VCBS repeat-containing protein n=1 Tax=Nonomuraea sp. SBT364 TaxID=1580530 RepID=UPI00066DEADD|nr:FG-GAP and VCBS repeat-containing protein [Nonomuraea sp. SBT364]
MNALLAACLLLPLTAGTAHAQVARCAGTPSDFDADGRPDVAVAAPYDDRRAGSVTILYGSGERVKLVQDGAEPGDAFGSALASGDFDGDRCADLAVGVSEQFAGKRVPGADGDGVVQLYRGSPGGLRPGRELAPARPSGDRFGASLAAGDLDGDGRDELAVGAPGMRSGGGVVLYWMKGREPYPITQRTGWVRQAARATDQWGESLATGDFDGDGDDELVTGAPADSVTADGQGSVTVLDVRRERALRITQSSAGIKGGAEKWDGFGAALATGDFDADGRDDLVVGVPGEGLTANQRAMDYGDGALHVLYGTRYGLRGARSEMWTQRLLKGTPRYYDRFGASLAAADFDGDGDDELAVGVPGENAVQVLAGAPRGGLGRHGDVLIKGKGWSVSALPATGGLRTLAKGPPPHGLVVAAPGKGVVTYVPGARESGLRPGRARELGSGEGLYGYAIG